MIEDVMVRIRLARGGAKKRPCYKIIVADSRNARDGHFIERIGFYNPIASGQVKGIHLDFDRLKYWIHQGATISKRISGLIKNAKK